jgi:predicted O-methyltransferase YrrM
LELYKSLSHNVQRILDIVIAPMYSKICITAIEMDIFSLLAKAQTAGALAEKQGWHALNTELFLDAVASLEFVKKEDGVYINTALANKYLVRGKPDFIGKYVVELYRSRRSEGVDLAKIVRNGPGNETPITMANVSFTDMADMMRNMQAGGRSVEVVDMLRSLPEYRNAKKMLDLGCGAGIIGIAAVQEHPTMHAILYDVPDMGDAVGESIRMQKAAERVQFMGGNYLTDNIGSDYDIVLAIGTLNFAKSSLVPLMEKVHAALNEGGVMICVGDGVHKDGTSPKDVLAGWLVSGLQGADYRMHQGMIANAALKAGFRNVRTLANIASYMGTIDIEILRK